MSDYAKAEVRTMRDLWQENWALKKEVEQLRQELINLASELDGIAEGYVKAGMRGEASILQFAAGYARDKQAAVHSRQS